MSASELTKKLQVVELEILKQFIAVCEKLNLRYYLLGGTLLGAVRHKGFIPWDDDIDVGMPREDYDRLLKEGQHYIDEGYFIQSHISDAEYPLNFAKVRDSKTTFIETNIKNFNVNHGIYIDIFPLDYYPEDKKEIRRFIRKNRRYVFAVRKKLTVKRISFLKDTKQFLIKCLPMFLPYKKAVKKREELFRSVGESNMIANHCGAWGKKEIVPKEWYGDGCILEFEGLQVRVPKEYDLWLKQVYGDYMQLPPEEKRVAHHFTEVIDLDKSYLDYVKK